jgi:hypothetical protein
MKYRCVTLTAHSPFLFSCLKKPLTLNGKNASVLCPNYIRKFFALINISGNACRFLYRVKSSIIWDMTPCSPLKVNPPFRGIRRRRIQAGNQSEARRKQSLALKIEMSCYFETSLDFQRNIRRYIREDDGQTVMMNAIGEIL